MKASAEKASKGLELSLGDLNKKIEEQILKMADFLETTNNDLATLHLANNDRTDYP